MTCTNLRLSFQCAYTAWVLSTTSGRAQRAPVEAKPGERADVVGLRLSHENTYLSWSRNGIIATVAAVGIHSVTFDNASHRGQASGRTLEPRIPQPVSSMWLLHITPPAAAMLGVAGTFFSFGTVQYIAQLSHLGPLLHLTPLRKAWMGAHALSAAGFWALGVWALVLHQPRATLLPSGPTVDNAGSKAEPPASGLAGLDRRRSAGDFAAPASLAISAGALLVLIAGWYN